jgi:hypothetical protein
VPEWSLLPLGRGQAPVLAAAAGRLASVPALLLRQLPLPRLLLPQQRRCSLQKPG